MSLERSLADYLAGELPPAARAAFEEEILTDADALAELVEQRRLDAALRALLDPAQDRVEAAILASVRGRSDETAVKDVLAKTVRAKIPRPQVVRRAFRTAETSPPSWVPALGMTSVMILLVAVGFWWTADPKAERMVVAQVRAEAGARWPDGYRGLRPGLDLRQGALTLEAGVAELEFINGATVTIEGPARLELASADRVLLREGKLAAQVPVRALGFTVETAAGKVVDLGTRFGVKVARNGFAEAHVMEGTVDVFPKLGTNAEPQRLTREMALAVNPETGSTMPIKFTPEAFPQPARTIGELLADGDFEEDLVVNTRGIPKNAGEWSGDLCQVTDRAQGIDPRTGQRMLRFWRADARQLDADDGWRSSELFQLVDLRPFKEALAQGGARGDFSAWFNRVPGDANANNRFAIAAAAFSGPVTDARAQWSSRKEVALSSADERLDTDDNPTTWQNIQTGLAIPPEADFLIVSIRAVKRQQPAGQQERFSGHFADSVSLRIVIPPHAGMEP
jgi:FecR protein